MVIRNLSLNWEILQINVMLFRCYIFAQKNNLTEAKSSIEE